MDLLYKPDWEETKKFYRAWWAHEPLGRCGLGVTAPRMDAPHDPYPTAQDPDQQWMDLDFISRRNDLIFRRTFYGGEQFPVWNAGYAGHGFMPAFLGAPLTADMSTAWIDPILTGADIEFESLAIKPDNRYWQFALAMLRRAAGDCKGKAIPSIGDQGGCGDTLAGLRGSERLLYDCMDHPERVRAAEEFLMVMWCQVYDVFYDIIRDAAEGSTSWCELWSCGKYFPMQCDFSYMISPEMFRRIFLPILDQQTQFLDHAVYHVDGEGAFGHVPALCELPRLQAIQIIPGDGKPSALHYLGLLKYVQRAGKNLQLYLAHDEVEPALRELSSQGLFIFTSCATEAQARQLLENARKWSKVRVV